ncbi:hypothetical protein ACFXKI_49940 [Streptomyces mirabilis]|uniref:hypothetical protein n=1 Tax=Streptomyces mirabilis TaxID=68239 RepID=UPI0036A376B4
MMKWRTLWWTCGISGLACLRSPLLLVAVPMLVWRFTSVNATYWDVNWRYSAPVTPVGSSRPWTACGGGRWEWLRENGRGTYDGGSHAAALDAAEKMIPAGAVVSALNSLLARLAAKCPSYWSGDPSKDAKRPAWIVVDTVS